MKLMVKLTSSLVRCDGLKIYSNRLFSQRVGSSIYHSINGSSNKTILCIPGALGSGISDFSYQTDELSKDFKVVTLDPRGYGQSKSLQRDFTTNFFEQDADDASNLMKALGIYV